MGFIRDMFRTAGEISTLTSQLKFSQDENERLVWQITQLEKEVKSERAAHRKDLLKMCDQISKQQGLPMKFEEKEAPKPPQAVPLTAYQEMQIDNLVKEMRAQAEEMNDELPSWEESVNMVKADIAKYQKEGLIS